MAQIGYNNNVKYRDRVFHIQTEDSGVRTANIITHLFVDGGRILHTMKTNYADRASEPGLEGVVKTLMKTQHKAMLIALREGKFDAEFGEAAKLPLRPSQLPPASLELVEKELDELPTGIHARTEPPPATQPATNRDAQAMLRSPKSTAHLVQVQDPDPVEMAGPPTLRSDPPDLALEAPRTRNTIVVHPPSHPEEASPDTVNLPAAPSDTLRPQPPSVTLSVPAPVPPLRVPSITPRDTSYRSLNPPQAVNDGLSRKLTAVDLARLPPEDGNVLAREERTERAALFRGSRNSRAPFVLEGSPMLDDVILAFLSS